jgi:hypothetical protein
MVKCVSWPLLINRRRNNRPQPWSLSINNNSNRLLCQPLQDLMLVTNAKGQVCHISDELAEMLGRTRIQAMANSASHVVETLMVRPFGHLHRALLNVGVVWFQSLLELKLVAWLPCLHSPMHTP